MTTPAAPPASAAKKRKIDDDDDSGLEQLQDLPGDAPSGKSAPMDLDDEKGVGAGASKVAKTEAGSSASSGRSLAQHLSLGSMEMKSDKFDMHQLKAYYERLFPVSLMWKWLSYGDDNFIKNREFSFTLEHDVYVRYKAFKTKEEFKNDLVSRLPIKIDIGAIYNASPLLKDNVSKFIPLSKELVFDVDMTDYDDVRRCCNEANVCRKCWPLMSAAITVTDAALRNDFGFRHIMWVFSGRRGVHCWVCDDRARALSNEGRTAVVEYLSVQFEKVTGAGGKQDRKVQITQPRHPSIKRAYDLLLPYFETTLLENQGILSTDVSAKRALEFLDVEVRSEFAFDASDTDSTNRWNSLKAKVEKKLKKTGGAGAKPINRSVTTLLQNIVFNWTFPRLDVNVSKQLNHLLKSPFCVHPKTGMVCIPIDPEKCDDFDPGSAPALSVLFQQLNKAAGADKAKIWEKTAMKPHIEYFEKFVRGLNAGRAKAKQEGVTEAADDW